MSEKKGHVKIWVAVIAAFGAFLAGYGLGESSSPPSVNPYSVAVVFDQGTIQKARVAVDLKQLPATGVESANFYRTELSSLDDRLDNLDCNDDTDAKIRERLEKITELIDWVDNAQLAWTSNDDNPGDLVTRNKEAADRLSQARDLYLDVIGLLAKCPP